ncbi:MAG: DNA-directed DNA polymerase II small subunit [archaeon]|nr:DNA-directed DNA polymerase II small subunit [Nanoarchaeota archaeon]
MVESTKKQLIDRMFEKGILVNKEMLERELNEDLIEKIKGEEDLIVLNDDYSKLIKDDSFLVDWYAVDHFRVGFEKNGEEDRYQSQLQDLKKGSLTIASNKKTKNRQELKSIETELEEDLMEANLPEHNVNSEERINQNIVAEGAVAELEKIERELEYEIVYSYETITHKYTVTDFTKIFRTRYQYLEKLIRQHPEMKNLVSINRLRMKKERENVSIIGVISDIAETKNSNLIITLEDLTGEIKILINKSKEDVHKKGKELVFDEVIGVVGVSGDNIIFVDDVIWPDIPSNIDLKQSDKEEYAIFLSDVHVGSNNFLEEEFKKFLKWTSGNAGNDSQRSIANKVKYIFIAGDLVDGIGIYPGQEKELKITDTRGQYNKFIELIKEIPLDKQIFICPGNHDAVHLAEPQVIFYKEYTKDLHNMPNVTLVSNPGMVNIAKTKGFSGFNILMYHGSSFDYYVANVDDIRNNGGYERADLIMKFLLKRRHLAPSYKSTPYLPAYEEDPLLIKKIPDFLITGHIHYSAVANYKGVTMIGGSCWQAKTKFQEKLGHNPEPGRVPIVNLKTREVKVLRFV